MAFRKKQKHSQPSEKMLKVGLESEQWFLDLCNYWAAGINVREVGMSPLHVGVR